MCHLRQGSQCPMPLPHLIYSVPLSARFPFRAGLKKATSGWLGSSCACGRRLQGQCLQPQFPWGEDLPAALLLNVLEPRIPEPCSFRKQERVIFRCSVPRDSVYLGFSGLAGCPGSAAEGLDYGGPDSFGSRKGGSTQERYNPRGQTYLRWVAGLPGCSMSTDPHPTPTAALVETKSLQHTNIPDPSWPLNQRGAN